VESMFSMNSATATISGTTRSYEPVCVLKITGSPAGRL
jgi:hypothetical protein